MFKGFSLGFICFFEAIGFIFKNKLWPFFFIPVLLTILLWLGGISLIQRVVDFIQGTAIGTLNLPESTIEDGFFRWFWEFWESLKKGLSSGWTVIIAIVLKIVFFFLTAILMKYIVLALMSPVLAYLSEKTEKIITGNDYPFQINQFVRDVWRGVLIAIRNFFIEFGLMIVIWIFFGFLALFFAPLATFAFVLLFAISSYFYGYSMLDYINERKRLSIREGNKIIRQNAGLSVALGMFIAVVPEISFWFFKIISSFVISTAAIIAVVGAVIAVNRQGGIVQSNANMDLIEGVNE